MVDSGSGGQITVKEASYENFKGTHPYLIFDAELIFNVIFAI